MLLWLEHQDESGGGGNQRNNASRITVPVLLIGGALDGETRPTNHATDESSTGHQGVTPTPSKSTTSGQ
jgi:hypothetical protein